MRTADADWSQYRIALEYEHDLFLAEYDGQVVGWAWLGYRHVYLAPLGRGLELGDGVGYLYDAYVRPPQRGRGVGAALVAARVAHAESLGLVRLVSHVMIGNTASRRALERAGFEFAGRTAFLRFLALRLWTRAPVRRVA
jgi:RimJ/RimL family protein N-acetyltransferase